jgi:hypothetical protein
MVSVLNLSPTRDVSTAERMSEYVVEPCSCGTGVLSSAGRRNEKTTGASWICFLGGILLLEKGV